MMAWPGPFPFSVQVLLLRAQVAAVTPLHAAAGVTQVAPMLGCWTPLQASVWPWQQPANSSVLAQPLQQHQPPPVAAAPQQQHPAATQPAELPAGGSVADDAERAILPRAASSAASQAAVDGEEAATTTALANLQLQVQHEWVGHLHCLLVF